MIPRLNTTIEASTEMQGFTITRRIREKSRRVRVGLYDSLLLLLSVALLHVSHADIQALFCRARDHCDQRSLSVRDSSDFAVLRNVLFC